METNLEESTTPSCSSNNDASDFECNICFELAHDPIVTLCGHLFCWPCLYKWLNIHSHSHECPVCKALVEDKNLVPLYGRGKAPSDPRSRTLPDLEIPHRPAGQRPETAPPPPQHGLGFGVFGGFMPMGSARVSNVTFSAAFGGLIPSLFNLQVHGFHGASGYGSRSGSAPGFPHGGRVPNGVFNGGDEHLNHQSDSSLAKTCLLLFGVLTILYLIL